MTDYFVEGGASDVCVRIFVNEIHFIHARTSCVPCVNWVVCVNAIDDNIPEQIEMNTVNESAYACA